MGCRLRLNLLVNFGTIHILICTPNFCASAVLILYVLFLVYPVFLLYSDRCNACGFIRSFKSLSLIDLYVVHLAERQLCRRNVKGTELIEVNKPSKVPKQI